MEIFKSKKDGGIVFVRMDEDEGIRLVEGIMAQLRARSTNVGRAEFRAKTGEYFSVSVSRDGKAVQHWAEMLDLPAAKTKARKGG